MQRRQSLRNRLRTVVVETKPINQRLLLGQSKDARLGISRLRFCSHGPNLNKTEPERCPRRKSNTVFVQSGRKSNGVWEVQTKLGDRFRCWSIQPERSQVYVETRIET